MLVKIPVPSSALLANLLLPLGLVLIVVAVGLLAGLAWALLASGLVLVGVSVLVATAAERARPAVEAERRPRAA